VISDWWSRNLPAECRGVQRGGWQLLACQPGQQSRSSFTSDRMMKGVEVNDKWDKIQHEFSKDRSSQTKEGS